MQYWDSVSNNTLSIQNIVSCFLVIAFGALSARDQLTLPKPTGSYAVGTKAIEYTDKNRTQFRGSGERQWMVQAWYPIDAKDAAVAPPYYMPGTLHEGRISNSNVQVFAHATPNAPLAHAAQPFPLAVFQPGYGGERQAYTIVCEDLASNGFVVLSLDEPYNANYVRFPDGTTIVPTLYDVWKIPRDRDYRYSWYAAAMDMCMGDITYMIDHLSELSAHEFDNRLDTKKIVLMGHSFGGNVAHTLGFKDPRVSVVIDIDSKITDRIDVPDNPSGKPVLFIRSNQYQHEGIDAVARVRAITPSVVIFPVQHSGFGDMAYLSHVAPNFNAHASFLSKFWNWFWKKGPLFSAVDNNLGGQEVHEWFNRLRKTIVDYSRSRISMAPVPLFLPFDNHVGLKTLQDAVVAPINAIIDQEVRAACESHVDTTSLHFIKKPRLWISFLYVTDLAVQDEPHFIDTLTNMQTDKRGIGPITGVHITNDFDLFGQKADELVVKMVDTDGSLARFRAEVLASLRADNVQQKAAGRKISPSNYHQQFEFLPHISLGKIPLADIEKVIDACGKNGKDVVVRIRERIKQAMPPVVMTELSDDMRVLQPHTFELYGKNRKVLKVFELVDE